MTPAPARAPSPASSKGEETRASILSAAVEQASAAGFESLTIGTLAERTGLSKSGLFAHFGSKLELQIAALDEASRQFTESVFLPALKAPRGLKRLRALFENWLAWPLHARLPGGCPVDLATREYQHRPGSMRDIVLERQRHLERELRRMVELAVESGELRKDTDTVHFVFEFFGIILVFYRAELVHGRDEARRHAHTALERLIRYHAV
jgi:AcrR family transcriptional regulator